MAKYIVYITATLHTSIEVEADDKNEAEDKAISEIGDPCGFANGLVGWSNQPADAGGILEESTIVELAE